jgi:CxxC motif-containing protein (DUF1111 family)
LRIVLLINLSLLACATLTACSDIDSKLAKKIPIYDSAEALAGGETSASPSPFPSLEKPANNLPTNLKPMFYAGKALARQPWVKAPTVTSARDGLGPIYNARTCMACHIKGGKGRISNASESLISEQLSMSALIRVSIPGKNKTTGVVPHPYYGDQIQTQSISLAHQLRHSHFDNTPGHNLEHNVAPEAYVKISWSEVPFSYPDGSKIILRKPTIKFNNLAHGPIGKDTQLSIRVAPSIHGMGLIELISQLDIDALSDENDRDLNGISGRVNQVWDTQLNQTRPGRFGLKSNKPTLTMTVAAAFANDLGISNPVFPNQPCTQLQVHCHEEINGNDKNGVELSSKLLEMVINFNRNLAPLKRHNTTVKSNLAGRDLFYKIQCSACHKPSFVTAESEHNSHLGNQKIWPYSDFLLHDMGFELSDGRPEFLASGSEWRTPPLWGLGVMKAVSGSTSLLHDGRANSIEEAILWHGGEADTVKNNFINLPKPQRQQLVNFVNSL